MVSFTFEISRREEPPEGRDGVAGGKAIAREREREENEFKRKRDKQRS